MDSSEHCGSEKDDECRWREIVDRYVSSLKFGMVQITVHDSKVTQIEKTEKTRLDNQKAKKN
jgi:hypothetical protein